MIPFGKKSTTTFILGNVEHRDKSYVWAITSEDRSEPLEDIERKLWAAGNSKAEPLSSFAVASDNEKDVHLVYAVGKANHQVFHRRGRVSGRTTSDPVEITDLAKDQGEDVWFSANGLVVRNGKKNHGRILIPYFVAADSTHLYVLSSDDGKSWQRIGPVLENAKNNCSIIELADGRLLASSGSASDGKLHISYSRDGGDTWGEGQATDLQCPPYDGELVSTVTASGKEVLVYATANFIHKGWENNHLDLYYTTDHGMNWERLRRIEYGGSYHPGICELEPGKLGMAISKNNNWAAYREVDLNEILTDD